MSDIDKWKESYKIGLPIRKKLTDYTPNKLKELLYSFGNIAQQICNKDFDEDRGSEKFTFVYGGEKNNGEDIPPVDFILNEATLSYGYYDHYEVRIDCLGIFVSFKAEHKSKEIILSVYWNMYENLKNQHLEIFP